MQNITPLIDYRIIADAQAFYTLQGFTEIAVPWILQYEAYGSTRPPDRKEFYTLNGYLNASGEQSFIEMMLSGTNLGKNFCITTCFRDEPEIDDLHHKYFVKLELINTEVTPENLLDTIETSKKFFDLYVPKDIGTKVIPMDSKGEMFDIVDSVLGIELGSYGIRRYKHLSWIYGTGIALPRLNTVLRKAACTQQ